MQDFEGDEFNEFWLDEETMQQIEAGLMIVEEDFFDLQLPDPVLDDDDDPLPLPLPLPVVYKNDVIFIAPLASLPVVTVDEKKEEIVDYFLTWFKPKKMRQF
jgi:hypothetical protein